MVNALGLKLQSGQSLDSLVTLQEATFQVEPVSDQIAKIQSENRLQSWVEVASRYVPLAIAAAALLFFMKTLKKQAFQAVPMEMLAAPPDATKRALQNPGSISPDLLNELIRAKPANIGTALRDWATPKKN